MQERFIIGDMTWKLLVYLQRAAPKGSVCDMLCSKSGVILEGECSMNGGPQPNSADNRLPIGMVHEVGLLLVGGVAAAVHAVALADIRSLPDVLPVVVVTSMGDMTAGGLVGLLVESVVGRRLLELTRSTG